MKQEEKILHLMSSLENVPGPDIKHNQYLVPTTEIKGLEISRLLAPCVYGWQRRNEWLYIGFSSQGLARVFNRKHHVLGYHKILPIDSIYTWQPENFMI